MEEKHGSYLKHQNIVGSIVEGKGNEMNEKWGNRADHSPNEGMQLTEKNIHSWSAEQWVWWVCWVCFSMSGGKGKRRGEERMWRNPDCL